MFFLEAAAEATTWVDQLIGAVIPLVVTVLGALATWGIRKLNVSSETADHLQAMTTRGLDKSEEFFGMALSPDSDGGRRITKAELSILRNYLKDFAIAEAQGPVAKMLKAKGENWIKSKISDILTSKGVIESPPVPVLGDAG